MTSHLIFYKPDDPFGALVVSASLAHGAPALSPPADPPPRGPRRTPPRERPPASPDPLLPQKFLEKSRDIGPEMLLNQQDLEAMFGMFDVTRKGTVTMRQAREALKTVLGPEADFPVDLDADDDTLLKVGDFVSKMSGALHASMPETRGK